MSHTIIPLYSCTILRKLAEAFDSPFTHIRCNIMSVNLGMYLLGLDGLETKICCEEGLERCTDSILDFAYVTTKLHPLNTVYFGCAEVLTFRAYSGGRRKSSKNTQIDRALNVLNSV